MKRLFLFFTIFFLPALHAMGDSSRRISVTALLNPSSPVPPLPAAVTLEAEDVSAPASQLAMAIPLKYQCLYCQEAFAWYIELKAHYRTAHNIVNCVDCLCSQCLLCMRMKSIARHRCTGEPKPFACPVCGRQFSRRESALRHKHKPHRFTWYSVSFPNNKPCFKEF